MAAQRVRIVLFWVLLLALLGAACQPADVSEDQEGGPGDTETISVGVSIPEIRDPFYLSALYGVSLVADEEGVDVSLVEAGGFDNVERQVSQIEDLIVRDVDAILLNPADTEAVKNVIANAEQEGIHVLGLGLPLGEDASGFAGFPHCELGNVIAQWVISELGEGGTVAIEAGPAGAFWAAERTRCFREAVTASNWEVVAEQNSLPDRAEALSLAEDFLQRFPDVNVIYSPTDFMGQGVADAVNAAGKSEEVAVVTSGLTADTADMLRRGLIQMTADQRVVVMGRSTMHAMFRALGGESNPAIIVPPRAVTAANIGEVDLSDSIPPEGWSPDF